MEIIEMKMTENKLLNKLHSRVELTKDGISELEDGSVEFTPSEKPRNRLQKEEQQCSTCLGDNNKNGKFHIIKVPEIKNRERS